MSSANIFDHHLITQRLKKARAQGYSDFLLRHVLDDCLERLSLILREFPVAVDVETPLPLLKHGLLSLSNVISCYRMADDGDVKGSEEYFPFKQQSLDLVTSLLSLHNVNDLPGSLIQIRQSLKPDGLFLACLLGGQTLHELRHCFMQAEAELSGGVSPRVHPFADVKDMGGLLQRAGFALPVADQDRVIVRYTHPLHLMQDLRAMGWTNALVERSQTFLKRSILEKAITLYQDNYTDRDGKVRATFDLIWILGWAPHERQQQPLKPGSATIRLANALKTQEINLSAIPAEQE